MKKQIKSKTRPSWSVPEDVKQEIRDMVEDGLNINRVSKYLGLSYKTIQNVIEPHKIRAISKKYYLKNRSRIIKQMKEYSKIDKNRKTANTRQKEKYASNPEYRQRNKEWHKKYYRDVLKKRYHTDAKYRENKLRIQRESYARRKKSKK